MSYSVSVTVKDTITKERMLEFLEDSYRPWYDILEEDGDGDFFSGPSSMHGRPSHIGFSYESPVGPERSYNYSILRWIALRTGRRRKHFKSGDFVEPVPYFMLWSPKEHQAFPIIPEDTRWIPNAYQDFVVDRYGLLKDDRTARELAWRNIPIEIFGRVSVTHYGQSPENIKDALIRSGIERARVILQFIRAEISRLDVLWND